MTVQSESAMKLSKPLLHRLRLILVVSLTMVIILFMWPLANRLDLWTHFVYCVGRHEHETRSIVSFVGMRTRRDMPYNHETRNSIVSSRVYFTRRDKIAVSSRLLIQTEHGLGSAIFFFFLFFFIIIIIENTDILFFMKFNINPFSSSKLPNFVYKIKLFHSYIFNNININQIIYFINRAFNRAV
uniref:Uncharacterized protein n=1 Tax=Cacopsylla melanoneura TaxID=428564 RepID=A0A8D8Q7U9_9HEMI